MANGNVQMAQGFVGTFSLQTEQATVFCFFVGLLSRLSWKMSSSISSKASSFFVAFLARGEAFRAGGAFTGLEDIHSVKAVSKAAASLPRLGPSKLGSLTTASKSSPPCWCSAGSSQESSST